MKKTIIIITIILITAIAGYFIWKKTKKENGIQAIQVPEPEPVIPEVKPHVLPQATPPEPVKKPLFEGTAAVLAAVPENSISTDTFVVSGVAPSSTRLAQMILALES